jgi:hypothetical protein
MLDRSRRRASCREAPVALGVLACAALRRAARAFHNGDLGARAARDVCR